MIELESCRILIQLERTLDITKIVILKLQEPRYHFCQMLLVLLRSGLIGSCRIALLLNDPCGLIEGPTRYEALLSCRSLNI